MRQFPRKPETEKTMKKKADEQISEMKNPNETIEWRDQVEKK